MIKLEVIEEFTLKDFDKLCEIVRAGKDEIGHLYEKDTFTCDKEMADYLLGENPLKRAFVKVIEVIPEKSEEIKVAEEETTYIKPKKKKK